MNETRVAVANCSEAVICRTETLFNVTQEKTVRTIPNILLRRRSSTDRANKATESSTEQVETRLKGEFGDITNPVTKNGRRRKQEIRLKDLRKDDWVWTVCIAMTQSEGESEKLDAAEAFSLVGEDQSDYEVSSTSQRPDNHKVLLASHRTDEQEEPSNSQLSSSQSLPEYCFDDNNNWMDIQSIVEGELEEVDTDPTDHLAREIEEKKFIEVSYPLKKGKNDPKIFMQMPLQRCWICDKTYKSKISLRYHQKRVHDFNERAAHQYAVLTCNWCSKKYRRISAYENHLKNHLRADKKLRANAFFF